MLMPAKKKTLLEQASLSISLLKGSVKDAKKKLLSPIKPRGDYQNLNMRVQDPAQRRHRGNY